MHDGHICDRFERSHRVRSFRHRQRGIHVTVFRKKEKVNTFCSWSAQRGRIRRGKKKKRKSRRRNSCERFCRTCPSPSRRGRSRAAKALYLGRRDDDDEDHHHHHHHRTTTTRIPISILPRKKEEREEKEKARFWSPGRKRKRRRKARRHLRTTRRLRDDTVNESIHRIKRIIYNGETKTTDQPFFCFFFVSLSFFFCADKTDDFSLLFLLFFSLVFLFK